MGVTAVGRVSTASSHLSDGAHRTGGTGPGGMAAVKTPFCFQMLIVLDSNSFLFDWTREIIKQKTYSI